MKLILKSIISILGLVTLLSSISFAQVNWAPIIMGDITTFAPYGQTNELKTLKNVYKPNDVVSIKVDAALSGDQDWVGVYHKNASSAWDNVVAWNWVSNGTTALSTIKKTMPVGAYEARLFFHNNFEKKASYPFTVAESNFQTSKAKYAPNETVSVTVNVPLSGDKDWVGIFHKNADNSWGNVVAWNWITKKGAFDLTKDKKSMPAGEYEARLFWHNAYGAGVEAKQTFGFSVTGDNDYVYGQMGIHDVAVSQYSQDNRAVIYHPVNWNNTPTPVIFFAPGWHNTTHASYKTLLRFVASHGYSVIYMPDDGRSYYRQALKFDAIVNEFSNKLDTRKIGVLGHSAGGGAVFYLLEHMIAKGYGAQGRFMMSLDGYFAYYMDKENMQNLTNTNIVLMQFGPSGNSTDPRVVLTNYKLMTGAGIDKNYIVLPNDNDHGYPARQNIDRMQGMLKPLDALMQYTFVQKLDTHHALALEGEGKVDPYANAYQKVLEIDSYDYSCEYSNRYHKGPDGQTASNINNCGVPKIAPN